MDMLKSIILNDFIEFFNSIKASNKNNRLLLKEAQHGLIDFVNKEHVIDNNKIIKFINKQLYKAIETTEDKVSVLSIEEFLNNVYLEFSRELWNNPHLFLKLSDLSGNIELIILSNFKKMRLIEEIINVNEE